MSSARPDPDQLLARVQAEEGPARRGRLKLFFGYAAGVGKTYAMLEAARRERDEGVDVVVGYVEPHGRPETEALLQGLEEIPSRQVPYRGVQVREFDLDAALARRPRLILVDELAHTNVEGSRHAKRWQDVEELLDAGIDVWTTLNVQHLESLNDVIAQITGTVVRETLPDAVLERANELELVDLTPEELIERLQAGKVYIPLQAERALKNFFQKSNLVALRELALRQAADRLHREVDKARQDRAAAAPWATSERLLVCVGPSPTSARLIRTAKRMADAFGAEWLAVAVESAPPHGSANAARESVGRHFQLAERLGAETHTLVGAEVARTILEYARSRNITKIIVGKTAQPWWKRWLGRNVVDALLDESGEIDVYVIRGELDEKRPRPIAPPNRLPFSWRPYLYTALIVACCGLLGWLFQELGLAQANKIMVFLLGVVFVATRYGRGPAIAASVANVLVFDYFFVEPFYSFAVSDVQYLFTFAVMLGIGLLISELTSRLQDRFRASQQQERRTAALYRLTKQLSEVTGSEFLVQAAGLQLREIFASDVVIFLRESSGNLELRFGQNSALTQHAVNAVVAQWVSDHEHIAGAGTDTLPNATALFVPLIGSQRTVGAIGVRPTATGTGLDPEQRRLLETCASLIALSIERDQSVLEAQQAQLQVQAEQLRNSLLSSVSHDLRTPLAAIVGAASSLLEYGAGQDPVERQELLQSIMDEAGRMTRLVENLLDMTRLESGTVGLNRQWHVLEELIGSVRRQLERDLAQHPVSVEIPADFPLLLVDGLLLEQVFVNLLENAAMYTPPGARIEISAQVLDQQAIIRVRDTGPGLQPGTERKVFEKFFRGAAGRPDGRRGVGLGLAICRAIIGAHAGTITAANHPGGGAEFTISLPRGQDAPRVELDEVTAHAGA
jgi:two-component system sensor histidine kinase KdpD